MKNELLAPNGKPSNLNAEQYKLVRSKAFIDWFGDWENDSANASKVVDENGEPLVCYHGTVSKNLNLFDEKKIGDNTGNEGHYGYGFYFSYSKIEASTYTYATNPIILECFLNIRNPFLSSDINHLEKYAKDYNFYEEKKPVAIDSEWLESELKKRKDQKPYLLYKSIKENGYEKGWKLFLDKNKVDWNNETFDYNRISDWFEYDSSLEQFSKENESENYNDEIPEFILEDLSKQLNIPISKIKTIKQYTSGNYPRLIYMTDLGNNSRSLTEEIKRDGFDGIIAGSEIVLFKSNQIKLADGTNITFDSKNDDIRFEQGGDVKDLIEETTDKLVKEIIKNNYYVDVSHSKTNFGKSNYIYVSNKVDEYGFLDGDKIKIRISDHDVSNFDRVFNEIHLQPYNKFYNEESYFKNTINQLNYYFNNDKFFDKENSFEDVKAYNVQTFQLWDNDIVTKEYVTKKGNKMFEVTRTYRNPITVFKHKGTQKVYKKIPLKYENGGRTTSQTPAPKKDRIVGSDLNIKSSSKNLSSAKLIKFDAKTLNTIKNKVATHNEENPNKKINLASAKAVVRRGMGAYSKSHRPTISDGLPNSRVAWGLARLNAFTYKIINGKSKSGNYSQDDDLIDELGFKVANYKKGGEMTKDIRCVNCGWEWNKKDSELWDMYVCHKCGFDNTTFYTSIPINKFNKGGKLKTPNYLEMFLGK